MQFLAFAVLICLTQVIQYSFACVGYNVKLKRFENGKADQTVSVEHPEIKMTSGCQLLLKGCLNIKKPIHSATIKFDAKKDGLDLVKGKVIDVCELLKDSRHNPYQCPFKKPAHICDNFAHPIDLTKFKQYLKTSVGHITVKAVVNIDNDNPSTFDLELVIYQQ